MLPSAVSEVSAFASNLPREEVTIAPVAWSVVASRLITEPAALVVIEMPLPAVSDGLTTVVFGRVPESALKLAVDSTVIEVPAMRLAPVSVIAAGVVSALALSDRNRIAPAAWSVAPASMSIASPESTLMSAPAVVVFNLMPVRIRTKSAVSFALSPEMMSIVPADVTSWLTVIGLCASKRTAPPALIPAGAASAAPPVTPPIVTAPVFSIYTLPLVASPLMLPERVAIGLVVVPIFSVAKSHSLPDTALSPPTLPL